MKSIEQIKNEVRTYVTKITYVDKNKLDDDTLLLSEGCIDSMGIVSLVAFLTEKFCIEMQDEDLVEENFKSINAVVELVIRKTT